MPADQSEDFKKAVIDSRKLKAKPNNDELLDVHDLLPNTLSPQDIMPPANLYRQLYALFKQGTQDPPFEETDKPGVFDFKVLLIPPTSPWTPC
jgi:diazepam-binding inhibitor (GABA receptor modulator, acyl-CoA-binding protein)